MMPDTVLINAWTGYTGAGTAKPTFSSTTREYKCRIELKNHLVIDSHGREVMARGRVIMGTVAEVDVRDQVTLPDEYNPIKPPIIAVNLISDEDGPHHTTLEIG